MKDNPDLKRLLAEAWAKRREAKYDDARGLVEEAHILCEEEDFNSLGRIFHVYMQFESDFDNYSEAIEFSRKSINYYKKAKNFNRIAHATRHLADLQYQLENYADSELNYREALEVYREHSGTYIGDLANALRGFGLLLEKRGKIKEAITVWKETKDLYTACNLQEGVDEAKMKLDSLS